MIQNLTFFNEVEDLEKITGLTEDQLWEHGANLDDWDYGFCSDEPLHKVVKEEKEKYEIERWDEPEEDGKYYKYRNEYDWHNPTYKLMEFSEGYCVGWHYFEYNGKHYYTVHHS